MEKAQILTSWKGTGTQADPYGPKLPVDHPVLSWSDVTGQPSARLVPTPNLYVIEVQAETAQLDAIELDANYQILFREEIVDANPIR